MAVSTLSPTPHDLCQLSLQFEDAHAELLGAMHDYATAANTVANCKHHLELQRAEAIAQGVEGKNAEQREANLRLELSQDYAALHTAEQHERQAKHELECKRLEWNALRYRLRALDAASRLASEKG